ncbi:hypothetical protein VTK73DRAFT_4560 [Phialemonium thermophilum]|uniref:Sphingoid long-chain base transporter RSB1 n=1 Tax=Phialemonium thermophilum TaxID=223376 RepID=A0ABR3WSK7_9PEZI
MPDYSKAFYSCSEVNPQCPVEATVLGYYPNLGANITLAIGFGVCAIATAALGIWKKTWSYTAAVSLGCALEAAGYVGRIKLHSNPWNSGAFELQMVVIILAPALLCISIYLTLKHLCLSLNPSLSRVSPSLYPFIFVPLDVCCLAVQAIGGGLAAVAAPRHDTGLLGHGNRTIIAGISLQVLVLAFFGALAADYFWRAYRYIKSENPSPDALALWRDGKVRFFCYAVAFAYLGILIRCTYRIAEMAGGWGNPVMRDEPSFIVLEGFMILLPAIALAAFPPGFLFPTMASRMSEGVVFHWQKFQKRRAQAAEARVAAENEK